MVRGGGSSDPPSFVGSKDPTLVDTHEALPAVRHGPVCRARLARSAASSDACSTDSAAASAGHSAAIHRAGASPSSRVREEFVRIIDALLPPLYVSQNHTHTLDNVAVTSLPGIERPRRGPDRLRRFSRGGYSHVITNPNAAPMRFIAVELRSADRGSVDDVPQPDRVTVLNNARVRMSG